jgi:excisionase family DNA binding protein
MWMGGKVVETKLERLLLRPAEAAEILGVSRSKLYELIAQGKIPSVRLDDGRLIRVPLAALKALVERAGA